MKARRRGGQVFVFLLSFEICFELSALTVSANNIVFVFEKISWEIASEGRQLVLDLQSHLE